MRAATIVLLGLLGCTSPGPKTVTPAQAMENHLEQGDAARSEGQIDAALREYRFVYETAPASEPGARARDAIVEIELARIGRGEHLPVPQPDSEPAPPVAARPETLLQVDNRTGGRLHVFVQGISAQIAEVETGGSAVLSVLPGEAQVAIRSDDPAALPFLGRLSFNLGALHRVSLGDSPSPR